MADLWKLSAVELAEGIRTGEFSCQEVMASVSGRIDKLNGRLNAITVDLREEAAAAAAEADRVVAAGGELGPLHGVPVAVKENVDMAGLANTNGIPAFVDMIATEDSAAGAQPEAGRSHRGGAHQRAGVLDAGDDRQPAPWPHRQPVGGRRSPGGSSGGAGVSAAAGFGPLHHGNDIGGSLRFPSSADGVCTVKPTSFRVPVFNSSAPAERAPCPR